MRIRSFLGALVLLLAVVHAPASARGKSNQPNLLLRGVTVFTASHTSSALIQVPAGVDLADLDISYEGRGRVKGVIMRKVGSYEQEGFRPTYENVSIATCSKRACKASQSAPFAVCWNCSDKAFPGKWTLYIIADGAPVTVTVRIDGATGNASFDLKNRVAAQIKTLPVRVDVDDGHHVYSAGGFTSLKRADYGQVGMWMLGEPHIVTAADACLYYGRQRYPNDVAWGPSCSLLADSFPVVRYTPAGRGGIVYTSSAYDNPRGLGAWYSTVSTVQRHGAVAFWIDF